MCVVIGVEFVGEIANVIGDEVRFVAARGRFDNFWIA
jgi:hypothetical protein